MNRIEIEERKLLRGNVISKLYDRHGEDLRIAVLKNLLRAGGLMTEKELLKAIYYLGDREGRTEPYIHVEKDEDNWLDGKIWLTRTGINLAEGDIDDVGIEGIEIDG
ncbi:MAG: hypothetical protein OSJ72_17455 [Lachnospiraceae bacterium]|nr:hypothetical protein [Lachnospiraceae bacterium]